jgi:Serine carboxypeptidase
MGWETSWSVLAALAGITAATGCARTPSPTPGATPAAVAVQAGFLAIPPRTVTVEGQPVSIDATGLLFYNFIPAAEDPADKPVIVLFNGFADDIVRAYGTGPMTVVLGGDVVPNPSSFTRFANLLYVEPRQAGYSYDVLSDRPPGPADCAPTLFNEYVDAADVLLAVLGFLSDTPGLRGPVYWLGESYAGVRVTWILAYLRGRWDLMPYSDPLLEARIAAVDRPASLDAGQILLESWLAGGADTVAIQAECSDPVEIAGVAASVDAGCGDANACACTTSNDRTLYNYTYSQPLETEREMEADLAHVMPDRAAALLGIPLTSIPLLAASERAKGFKCSAPDDTVPSDSAMVSLLGALPAGQSYFIPYSPLEPGKQTSAFTPDWSTLDYEAIAFADNLHDVPAFLTKGDLDLVVPTLALAPALSAALGAARVDAQSPSRLGITYADGERFVDVFDYPSAGHMVSMAEPTKLASDVEAWLPSASP